MSRNAYCCVAFLFTALTCVLLVPQLEVRVTRLYPALQPKGPSSHPPSAPLAPPDYSGAPYFPYFPSSLSPSSSTPPQGQVVHPFLERVLVSISLHWDVTRLIYIERVLMGINEWKSPRVDICLGSDHPALHATIFQDSPLKALNASGNVRICPLPGPLDNNLMLNWRSREMLGVGFQDTAANYTAFVFLEDDLMVSWEALVAWAEDTELLEPYGLKRSFFRSEIRPDTGLMVYLDLNVGRSFRAKHVIVPWASGVRRFVQIVGTSYCGMFVATRAQLGRYMNSTLWPSATGKRCCDIGGREYASWGFQMFETPDGSWDSEGAGVLPWVEETKTLDELAMIMHRPNNYAIRIGSKFAFIKVDRVNQRIRQSIYSEGNPPTDLHRHE